MKALSLFQPWAALVAAGQKKIETRSWSTQYRGALAIHVSGRIPAECKHLIGPGCEPFASALKGVLWDWPEGSMCAQQLPENYHLGCVIAVGRLVRCELIGLNYPASLNELSFGDFRIGRYAWILEDVRALETPVQVKGSLGLWEWAAAEIQFNAQGGL